MIHLTPELLEQLYETLRITRPFKGWKLPPGDEVSFHVNNSYSPMALYYWDGKHNIRLSQMRNVTLNAATMALAHEMIHLREKKLNLRQDIGHGKVFRRMAEQVCRHHGFDRGLF